MAKKKKRFNLKQSKPTYSPAHLLFLQRTAPRKMFGPSLDRESSYLFIDFALVGVCAERGRGHQRALVNSINSV